MSFLSFKQEILGDRRAFEENLFQSLGAVIEKALSPTGEKRRNVEQDERRERGDGKWGTTR